MAAVRYSTLGEIGDLSAPPGSRDWAIAVCLDIQMTLNNVKGNADHLDTMTDLIRQHEGWKHLASQKGKPFRCYEAFCVEPQPFGLGYRPQDIERIIGERRERQVKEIAGKIEAAKRPGAPDGNQNARRPESEPAADLPLMRMGAENKRTHSPVDSPKRPGPLTQDRLTSRIARDRPDILDRMKAGEFSSVRKAALEAGIVRPEFSIPVEPHGAARRILSRFQGEPLLELIRALQAGAEIAGTTETTE